MPRTPGRRSRAIFTNTVFGFIQAYILLAVYEHRTNVGGYDRADALTYVWLSRR